MSNNNYKIKGFTLIEMLVTALIFSIVVGAATGVFVSAIKLQKYNLSHQQLLSQVSYAMEYMERAIRMAVKDDGFCGFAGQNYNETSDSIKFATYHGQCWRFFLQDEQLKVYKKVDAVETVYDLTSDDFKVSNFNVEVSGDISEDTEQPKVTIFIEIEGDGSGHQPRIEIQTTISQRNFDF